MKHLLVTLEYPPKVGGISTYIKNFLSHATSAEFVVCAPKVQGGEEYDSGTAWKVYRTRPLFTLLWPRWLKLFFTVRRICKKEKIDSILIHHVLPVGYIGILLKKVLKIEYTIFLHGTDVQMALKNRWKRTMFAKILESAKLVVVNSVFLKNQVENVVGDVVNIAVIYPCAGDEFFNKVSESELNTLSSELALTGKKVVLTVARMVDGKGYPFMIREMAEVLKRVGNAVWIVVGDGPKRGVFVKLVQENGLQSFVRYLGTVPSGKLPAYYQLADIFLLLTHSDESAKESWGTVFMEAAACGTPVIAGRVGGVEEAVENGVTGIVVDAYQEKAVAATIVDLLKNTEFRRELSVNAQQRAEREFTWKKQISKLSL